MATLAILSNIALRSIYLISLDVDSIWQVEGSDPGSSSDYLRVNLEQRRQTVTVGLCWLHGEVSSQTDRKPWNCFPASVCLIQISNPVHYHLIFSCRVWDVEKMSSNPVKIMPNPVYVYAAQFHVRVNKVVVTGGYDNIIRVWSMQTDDTTAFVSVLMK